MFILLKSSLPLSCGFGTGARTGAGRIPAFHWELWARIFAAALEGRFPVDWGVAQQGRAGGFGTDPRSAESNSWEKKTVSVVSSQQTENVGAH